MCAIAADILTLEVDNVLCVTAEYAGRLVLLEDDMIAVNVDFQSVLYFGAAQSGARCDQVHQPYEQYRWISFSTHSISSS